MSEHSADDIILHNECNTYVMSCHLNSEALYEAMRCDIRVMCREYGRMKEQRDDLRVHCDGWEKQYRVLESSFFTIKTQRDELLAVLNKLRIDHYQCEDGYYSCPKSGDCPNSNPNDDCNCGADDHNAIIDAAITKVTP